MAERELKIIQEARVTLNDISLTAPRWSTERLMSLLSEAQEDMCRNIPLLTRKAIINTIDGQAEYDLPIDSIKLIHASSDGTPLGLISYDEIEDTNPLWEEAEGVCYSHIIVNALSQQTIRPYPLVGNKPIKTRYHAMPTKLGWVEYESAPENNDSLEELSIPYIWDMGLKQYVIGMALLDYGDEASNSRSGTALSLYNKEYMKALQLSKKSFAKRVITTGYQAKVKNTRYIGGKYGSGNHGFNH